MTTYPEALLHDLAESIDYGVTAAAHQGPEGYKFLRITDIQDGAVDWSTVPFCHCSTAEAKAARLRSGDIVFARTGGTTGKSFLIRDSLERAVFASYLIRVRPRRDMHPAYLAHYFQTPHYWRQIRGAARGAAQPGVNATSLRALRVPLPTLDKQRHIAAVLDQAEALRGLRRVAMEQIKDLQQALFHELFGDPAHKPRKWPVMPLGATALKFSDGPFGSNLKSSHYVESGVRVVRLQNIGVGEFLDDDKAFISESHFIDLRKHECLPGDVLIGTLGDPNLRACVQPRQLARALNKADCVQLRPNPTVANATYLCALLNHPSVERMAQGLMQGQTRVRISMGRLRGLEVPVPPLDVQDRFARRMDALSKIRLDQVASGEGLDALFASLQHRAFSGQL